MDVVLQSHQEVARFNAVCDICHTRYVLFKRSLVFLPGKELLNSFPQV